MHTAPTRRTAPTALAGIGATAAIIGALVAAPPALAADATVSTSAELIAAIAAANSTPGPGTITAAEFTASHLTVTNGAGISLYLEGAATDLLSALHIESTNEGLQLYIEDSSTLAAQGISITDLEVDVVGDDGHRHHDARRRQRPPQ